MTQEQTQMTDVDEDLANELLAFDEFVEDQTTTAIIEGVKTSGDQILVKATLPWNETVRRFFPHPKNDPGGEFQQLLAGVGLGLNAVKNLSEERVPCKYDGEEWVIVIPDRWTTRVWRRVADFGEGLKSEDLGYFSNLGLFVGAAAGWVLIAPVINLLIWLAWIQWEGSDAGDGDVGAAIIFGCIFMLIVDYVWLVGMYEFHPYLIEAIRTVAGMV